MNVKNSELKVMDPFVLNEDSVNQLVANFFKSRGFDSIKYLSEKETGIGVQAKKMDGGFVWSQKVPKQIIMTKIL